MKNPGGREPSGAKMAREWKSARRERDLWQDDCRLLAYEEHVGGFLDALRTNSAGLRSPIDQSLATDTTAIVGPSEDAPGVRDELVDNVHHAGEIPDDSSGKVHRKTRGMVKGVAEA
jgi:hypothetical protein